MGKTNTSISWLIFAIFLTSAGAQNSTCISEETKCTCSQKQFTGLCTRPRRDGICIEAACRPTMICDCLGFEICNIFPCGKHVATAGAKLSTQEPFECQFEPESNTCRVSSGVMATISSSNTAKEMSNMYVDQLVDYKQSASVVVATAIQHYSESFNAVRKVERFEAQVSPSDMSALWHDLDECQAQMHGAQKLLGELFELSERVYESMKNTKKFRQQALDAEESREALETQRKAASAAANASAAGCATCDALQLQIDALQAEVGEGAAAAATWAKTAREDQNQGIEKKDGIKTAQRAAEAARNRCLPKSEEVLASIVVAGL